MERKIPHLHLHNDLSIYTFHKTLPKISQMIFMNIATFILYFSGTDVDVSIKNLKDESCRLNKIEYKSCKNNCKLYCIP